MKTLVLNTMGVMKIMSCTYTVEYKGIRAKLTGTMGGGDHNDCSKKCSYLEDPNGKKDRHAHEVPVRLLLP